MATKPEQSSVEERLRSLYKLQTILSKIDSIKTIRGELPLEVNDLEDNIAGLKKRVENFTNEVEDNNNALNAEKEKIEQCKQAIAKYKEQLDEVQNSRQYDSLNKEIEYQSLEIELAEKHIAGHKKVIETKKAEIENIKAKIADQEQTLHEKKSELDDIVSETRQQEDALREEARKVEAQIDDERTLKAFKRIRKNARNGLGIVTVQRDACGGCFNRIPPQRQMEIKMHKKIIVCEYCGRIMIDPALTE